MSAVSTALAPNLCLADPADLEFTEAALPEDDPRFIHRVGALKTVLWRADEGDDIPEPRPERRPPQAYPPREFAPFELTTHQHSDGSFSLLANLALSGMVVEPELTSLFNSALAGLGHYLPSQTCPSLRHVVPANLAEARAFFAALLLRHATPCDDSHPPAIAGVDALRRRMLSELSEPQ